MDYDEFRLEYEKQHPASVPQPPKYVSEYPNWLWPLSLVMFLAVSLVSGVHTVSTMRYTMIESLVAEDNIKDLISQAAFLGFELSLFVSVFSWIRKSRRWLSYAATGVVFAVILLANIRDIERSATNSLVDAIMVFGAGIGTPLVALLSGKLFVDIFQSRRMTDARIEDEYRKALKRWDSEVLRAYHKLQQESRPIPPAIPPGQKPGQEQDKSKRDIVRDYLLEHPEARDLSVNELSSRLDIPRTTVGTVKQEFSSNGHNGHA